MSKQKSNRLPKIVLGRKVMKIPEVIIGITKTNELCYMKNTKDTPTITISGYRGYGMSLLLDRIDLFNHYKEVYHLNDTINQGQGIKKWMV